MLRSFYKRISRSLNEKRYLLDIIGRFISDPLNDREDILIFGVPHNGITWVMEVLETLPGYKSIFEPFRKGWFSELSKLNIDLNRPYVYYKDPHPQLKEYLRKVFRGKIISKAPKYRPTLRNI